MRRGRCNRHIYGREAVEEGAGATTSSEVSIVLACTMHLKNSIETHHSEGKGNLKKKKIRTLNKERKNP